MKIALTGATGFVGSRLAKVLQSQGHELCILTRNPDRAKQILGNEIRLVKYDPCKSGDWQGEVALCEAVINLAGEPIAQKRWTPSQKQTILDSRQIGTQKIVEAIAQNPDQPKVLINASAIGYYGTSETAKFTEESPPGKDFLASVCQAWEAEAQKVTDYNTRLVILRLGIVLGMGGALAKMLAPFKMFMGGPLGNGNQWFSWIHREDLVNLIIYALNQSSMTGVYNATAPQPVTMKEFCHILGSVMNRPSWLPVPNIALETLLGDGAIVVLEGQQVIPQRTLNQGFTYQYADLKSALGNILKE
jgi:hypothetical protein